MSKAPDRPPQPQTRTQPVTKTESRTATKPAGPNPLPSFGQQIAAKGGQIPEARKSEIRGGG